MAIVDQPRRFVFRFNVSADLGIGHLTRCAALAVELRRRGGEVLLTYGATTLEPLDFLPMLDLECIRVPLGIPPEEDARLLTNIYRDFRADTAVVDLYTANEAFQLILRNDGVRWLQFDPYAQQPLWADWVLNPNPSCDSSLYKGLTKNSETRLLLGTSYAILRPEFRHCTRDNVHANVRRLILTFGGGDDRGAILFCLNALKDWGSEIDRKVLVTSHNPHLDSFFRWTKLHSAVPSQVLVNESDVARRMAEADLAITGGGTTTFETAASGLPSLIIQIADNQRPNAEAWDRQGSAVNLGGLNNLTATDLRNSVEALATNRVRRQDMMHSGKNCVDGRGTERIVQELLSNPRQGF